MKILQSALLIFLVLAGLWPPSQLIGQVSYDRILSAANEPENWLTYNGTYSSQRYSGLRQITPSNVDDLELKWMLQNQVFGAWQRTPKRARVVAVALTLTAECGSACCVSAPP